MKISVQVKTKSKKESVEILSDGIFVVRVNAPPVEGKANERIQELLSEYFQVRKSSITLVSSPKSKKKIFSIG